MSSVPLRDALDDKVNRTFAGKVVRKDLVRKVKVGANVPVFVLEFLLGKYCASSDEMAIQMGLQVVNDTLANNYIRADEAMKAQSKVKEKGNWTFIDKIKVRLVDSDYWAEVNNFGNKFVHIQTQYVRDYERLLTGGIWAQIDMRFAYDEDGKGKNPFWIEKLTPIQIAAFDLSEYQRLRSDFTTDEWIDLMLRSMGYEPAEMTKRLKLLFMTRLVPLCERNYNLVELGPRGTGKSYVVHEVSPYAALMTGPTTVANLFGHMGGRTKGLVQIWDVVGFDEVADLEKMPKEVITTMKTYCESGSFQRGQEAASGDASIALFGNTQQAIDIMVQTGHLFEPMPEVIRDDMAFIDRLHFYLPGWEIPKMRNDLFTDHYGFVVDYLAEALRELRRHNFTEISDRHFTMGSHLVTREPEGGQEDRFRTDEDHSSERRGDPGRDCRTAGVRHGGPTTRQGTAQEDGLVRVLAHVLQLHLKRHRGRAFRWRARAGRPSPDFRRSAPARQHLHRNGCSGRDGRNVSRRGVSVGRLWQAPDGRWRERHHQGIDQQGVQLYACQKERSLDCQGARYFGPSCRSDRPDEQSRRRGDWARLLHCRVLRAQKGPAVRSNAGTR
jgi:uncharacterized protein (TIGR02688 family)